MKFKKYPIIGEVPGWDLNLYTNAEQKVGKLSSSALLDFADAAGSGMARGYMDYRSQARVESLLEIRHALMTLWALNEQLIRRHEAVARLDSSS